jgi:hypothetical protein
MPTEEGRPMTRSTGQNLTDGLVARGRTLGQDDEQVDLTAIVAGASASSRLHPAPRGAAQTPRTG